MAPRPVAGVTKSTSFLVVGQLGWPLLSDGQTVQQL